MGKAKQNKGAARQDRHRDGAGRRTRELRRRRQEAGIGWGDPPCGRRERGAEAERGKPRAPASQGRRSGRERKRRDPRGQSLPRNGSLLSARPPPPQKPPGVSSPCAERRAPRRGGRAGAGREGAEPRRGAGTVTVPRVSHTRQGLPSGRLRAGGRAWPSGRTVPQAEGRQRDTWGQSQSSAADGPSGGDRAMPRGCSPDRGRPERGPGGGARAGQGRRHPRHRDHERPQSEGGGEPGARVAAAPARGGHCCPARAAPAGRQSAWPAEAWSLDRTFTKLRPKGWQGNRWQPEGDTGQRFLFVIMPYRCL